MKHRHLTPEDKAAILKENERLSGSMHSRALKLSAKYNRSVITISNVIRHTITKFKRNMTEQDKQQICVLYSLETSHVEMHKFKNVAKQVGFSALCVRLVIKAKEKEEKEVFYNPKQYSYYD